MNHNNEFKKYQPPSRNRMYFKQNKQNFEEQNEWITKNTRKNRTHNKAKENKKFDISKENFPSILSENKIKNIEQNNEGSYKEKIKILFENRKKQNETLKPGMIQWKYNKKENTWTERRGCMRDIELKEKIECYNRINRRIDNMISKWQKYRDDQNELLLDRSPFWNEPSLHDPVIDDYDDYDYYDYYEDDEDYISNDNNSDYEDY